MSATEQKRGKIIPATFEASRTAIAKDETPSREKRRKSLWEKQPEDLALNVHTGYYPGDDMFYMYYQGLREDTESQTERKLWSDGINIFSDALLLTAKQSKLTVPRLSGHTLDAYDKALVDPKTTQADAQERSFLQFSFDDMQEQSSRAAMGYEVSVSPIARMRGVASRHETWGEIKYAVWGRAMKAEEVEPDFTRAVDSNRTFDNRTHRQFFLAGAVVVHDLFDLHYQIEDLKAQTGLE